MRYRTHDSAVYFRASNRLVAALSERAKQSGVPVAEYMRTIARREVGL